MSVSVKISGDCKRLLERLQARLVIATGRKMSQQELLDALVKLSMEREDELIRRIAGVKLPLPPGEVDKLMDLPADWGIKTREEEIDSHLYGQSCR